MKNTVKKPDMTNIAIFDVAGLGHSQVKAVAVGEDNFKIHPASTSLKRKQFTLSIQMNQTKH